VPLKVRVERLPSAESGRNLAFVDPKLLGKDGLVEGSVVELSTQRGRRLLARLAARPQDEGRGCIRLDRYQIQFLKPDLHEEISVTPVDVAEAKRLVLEPLAPVGGNLTALEREIGRRFADDGQLACSGMLIAVKLPDFPRSVLMRVISVDPEFGLAAEGTRVVLRTSALRPGISANLVTFDDVGGLHSEIDQIRELVECPLRFPEAYEALGIDPPRGILLYGPPGVGKTHLTRAIANEIGAHFLYINGPEIVSSVHGGTEANLRHIFEEAMEHSPSVVLIDELDAIAPQREDVGAQADLRMGTQLLSLLDGLISMEDVIVIGTTNRVNAVDVALRRPGRFDREIYVGPPDADSRLAILHVHTRRVPLTEDAIEYLPEVAHLTHGYVGADLMELVRRAGLNALRRIAGPGFSLLSQSLADELKVTVGKEDLLAALQQTHPSALRETLTDVPDVSWDEIGGLDKVIEALREAVEMPLVYADAFAHMRVKPQTGVLLYGPPGTGKTMLAKAVAKECGANFIPVNGPEIFSKWLGQSEEAIRHVFRMARQVAPAVVFFDQIDAIAPRRQGEAANATTERVVNQLLAEMDGIQPSNQIVVLAATNRRDLLDPALLRHGRLGLQLHVELPAREGREKILRMLLAGVPRDQDTDWEALIPWIADQSEGFSGADLAAMCDQAKRLALREQAYRHTAVLRGANLASALETATEPVASEV
jgi:transitional endoplasmic reticulum ATPase